MSKGHGSRESPNRASGGNLVGGLLGGLAILNILGGLNLRALARNLLGENGLNVFGLLQSLLGYNGILGFLISRSGGLLGLGLGELLWISLCYLAFLLDALLGTTPGVDDDSGETIIDGSSSGFYSRGSNRRHHGRQLGLFDLFGSDSDSDSDSDYEYGFVQELINCYLIIASDPPDSGESGGGGLLGGGGLSGGSGLGDITSLVDTVLGIVLNLTESDNNRQLSMVQNGGHHGGLRLENKERGHGSNKKRTNDKKLALEQMSRKDKELERKLMRKLDEVRKRLEHVHPG